jgi:ribose transport system substrate-binding protein
LSRQVKPLFYFTFYKEEDMKKKICVALIAGVLLLAFSFSLAFAEPGDGKKEYRIGYITRLSVPWWIVCEGGFKAAADDYGFKAVIYHPPELTVEDQVRVMESWIAAGLDAIMIGPNDPAAPIGVINQAMEAGIPVVTGVGVDSPDSDRLMFLGFSPRDLGVSLGKGLLANMKLQGKSPPGRISYHTGGMASSVDTDGWDGFRETVEAAGYTVIEPILDGGDPAKAMALAQETIELYPDLVGMLGYYDYTGPALGKAVTDTGKIDEIVVQADGLIGEMVPYLKTGAIDATIDLVQYDLSYIGAEILYKLLEADKSDWDDILKEYEPNYPRDSEFMARFGWVTWDKIDVEVWPEIEWILTVEEHKKKYPAVWEIID